MISLETLFAITQQLRESPDLVAAAKAFVAWIIEDYGDAYLMLPDGLLNSGTEMAHPDILRWLKDGTWKDLDSPTWQSGELHVPIRYFGKTQGVLVVVQADETVLSIVPMVDVLAMRLASIANANIIEQTNQLTRRINSKTQTQGMLELVVKELVPLFDVMTAIIFRFEPDDVQGEVIAEFPSHVILGQSFGANDYTAFSDTFNNNDFIVRNSQNTLIGDLNTALEKIGAQQLLAVPMLAAGRIIGVLALALEPSTEQRQFTQVEQQCLQMLAQVIGTAYLQLRHINDSMQNILEDAPFRQLIEKANVAIDIHQPNGTVIYRNRKWNELFRTKADESQVFTDRLLKSEQMMPETAIYPIASNHQGWTNFITLKRKDDTEFDAHVSVVALRDNDNNILSYSTITDDVTELHHVMNALQAQTSRLAAAASVSQAIITTPDLDLLAESVLRLICTQFDYDFAQIWTINEARDALNCIMACDLDGDVMSAMIGQTMSLNEENAAQWVINHGHLLMLNDAQADERHLSHPLLPPIGSELTFLLQAANEIQGILLVQSKSKDAFSLDDADVMQSISDQLAIAIYNASLFGQLRDRLADMNAMGEVSLLVQAAFDLDGLMQRIYDAMRRVHSSGDFGFAIYDEKEQSVNLLSYVNGDLRRDTKAIGDDLLSKMLTESAPIFWRSADERLATAGFFELDADNLPHSFLGLPLIAKDEVLGAVFTQSNNYAAFDENDLQFMLNLANSAAFALENMQLLNATKKRVHEMEIINNISHTLSETFGIDIMWDRLIDDLEDLFPHGFVTVALYNNQSQSLHVPASNSQQVLLSAPPDALATLVIKNGISLDFQDLLNEDERLESMGVDPFLVNFGALRSWVGSPLKSRNNESIGVIALQSDQVEAFSDRDLSLLNMVAAQTSLALDNALLLVAEQERREVANSLIDMGRIVSASLNVDDVFGRILEQIARLVKYERAAILIQSTDSDHLEMIVRAVDGFDEQYDGTLIEIHSESLFAQVIQTQEPIVLSSVTDSAIWEKQPTFLQDANVQSWMGIPLVIQSHVIGVITLDTSSDATFQANNATPIFALARQASVAVENARLHSALADNVNSLQLRADRLATMHRLANYVSSTLSQPEILNKATQLLTELFKADYVAVVSINETDGNGYLVAEYPSTDLFEQAVMLKGSSAYERFQHVVRQDKAIYISAQEAANEHNPIHSLQGGYVIAPLIAYESVLGHITLGFDDPLHEFDEENLNTFMTIAAQIALAVRNAQLYQDALEASRLKSEFLANVSHELRTPLNAIIGYSELLLSGTYGNLEDKQEDRLERVFRSGRQLLTLINDILDLSKIEAGKMQLELNEIDVSMLVEEAMSTIQPQADYKQLDIIKELQDNLPALFVDVQRMQQVFINLLSNAVKFTKEGQITFTAKRATLSLREFPNLPLHMLAQDNVWLHLSVSDTGIGISEKDQKLIFDAFTQADGSSIREYEGTGLGLAITQQLVKMHKGHIWLESELDSGSTFHILLPSMETMKRPRYVAEADDNRPVVILADEDEMTLRLMSEYLNPQVYNIIRTQDAKEIFEIAEHIAPSVIVTDLIMPNIEGLDLLNQLQENQYTKDADVIICSILDRESDSLALGATAFIKKPVTRRDLLSLLETIL